MPRLKAFEVPTEVKLSAAWAATVLCYIYCDYFDLYVPGKLQRILDGHGPFGPVTELSMVVVSVVLIVPSVMTLLSLVLPAGASKVSNIVIGAIYTIIMGYLAFAAHWYFYKLFAVVEAALTAAVVWIAWKWPRDDGSV